MTACISNYKKEEIRVYENISSSTFIYDSSRSDLNGLNFADIDSLHIQFNSDSTFTFVSTNNQLSRIKGTWRLSDFPELQFWVFKLNESDTEQWNRELLVYVKVEDKLCAIAFKKINY